MRLMCECVRVFAWKDEKQIKKSMKEREKQREGEIERERDKEREREGERKGERERWRARANFGSLCTSGVFPGLLRTQNIVLLSIQIFRCITF